MGYRPYRPAALKVFSKNPRGACGYHVTTSLRYPVTRFSAICTLHASLCIHKFPCPPPPEYLIYRYAQETSPQTEIFPQAGVVHRCRSPFNPPFDHAQGPEALEVQSALARQACRGLTAIRNRPFRSSLLDTRVIFCGDKLRPCAPFVVRSPFRVDMPSSAAPINSSSP